MDCCWSLHNISRVSRGDWSIHDKDDCNDVGVDCLSTCSIVIHYFFPFFICIFIDAIFVIVVLVVVVDKNCFFFLFFLIWSNNTSSYIMPARIAERWDWKHQMVEPAAVVVMACNWLPDLPTSSWALNKWHQVSKPKWEIWIQNQPEQYNTMFIDIIYLFFPVFPITLLHCISSLLYFTWNSTNNSW